MLEDGAKPQTRVFSLAGFRSDDKTGGCNRQGSRCISPHIAMGKALIIAEKPSVASDIAKALGGFEKHDEYFESDKFVLSSAVGHLLELCVPEQFEVKKGKWTFAALPMIPPHFDLRPIEKTESRLKVLAKLIKRKDKSYQLSG